MKSNIGIAVILILLVTCVFPATAAPIAAFTANATTGQTPLAVSFSDLSTGSPTGWAWFFGDEAYDQEWVLQTKNPLWHYRYEGEAAANPDNSIVSMGGMFSLFGNQTWISHDKGATWGNITQSPAVRSRSYGGSVVFPNDTVVVFGGYVVTNDTVASNLNDAWKSTDRGVTWTLVNASCGWSARQLITGILLPDDSIVILSDAKTDVWRSTDMGGHWTRQTTNHGMGTLSSFATAVTPNGTILVMGGTTGTPNNKTWASVNKGATWVTVNASSGWLPRQQVGAVTLADGSTIIIGGKDSTWTAIIDSWRTVNNGTTWTVLPMAVPITPSMAAFNTDPLRLQDTSIFFMTGEYSVRSADNGTSWEIRNSSLAGYNQTGFTYTTGASILPFSDGDIGIFAGTDVFYRNDVWRSTDLGVTWTLVTMHAEWQGRNELEVVTLPTGELLLYGGETDNGPDYLGGDAWLSPDKGRTWILQSESTANESCDVNNCVRGYHGAVALPDNSVVIMGGYVGANWELGSDVWRSADKGVTWTQQTANAEWGPRYWAGQTSLSDGSIIVAGGWDDVSEECFNDVWISTDQGVTWTRQTASAEWEPRMYAHLVSLPDDSLVFTSGVDVDSAKLNDTWVSHDRGVTWTEIDTIPNKASVTESVVTMPDGSIISIGGWDNSYSYQNVWRFNPVGSTEQNPVHTYTTDGQYNVSLQVRNSIGVDAEIKPNYILAGSPAVTFTKDRFITLIPQAITFNDTSLGSPTMFNWSFGDKKWQNGTASARNATHQYTRPGFYRPYLMATNEYGTAVSQGQWILAFGW